MYGTNMDLVIASIVVRNAETCVPWRSRRSIRRSEIPEAGGKSNPPFRSAHELRRLTQASECAWRCPSLPKENALPCSFSRLTILIQRRESCCLGLYDELCQLSGTYMTDPKVLLHLLFSHASFWVIVRKASTPEASLATPRGLCSALQDHRWTF